MGRPRHDTSPNALRFIWVRDVQIWKTPCNLNSIQIFQGAIKGNQGLSLVNSNPTLSAIYIAYYQLLSALAFCGLVSNVLGFSFQFGGP